MGKSKLGGWGSSCSSSSDQVFSKCFHTKQCLRTKKEKKMYHLTGSRRVSHQHNRQFFPLSMTPPPLSWGQQGQQHPPRRHQVFTMTWSLWNFYVDFSSTSEASGFQSHVIFTRFFADFSSQGFPQNNRNKPFGNVPFNSQVNSLIANYWKKDA